MKTKTEKTKQGQKTSNINVWDVCVIGGGPAGLMSAGIAGKNGGKVILLEKNEIMGKKLLLTGGGRCNITNAEPDKRKFVSVFGKRGSVLFSPLSVFGVDDTIRFFEGLGLKTKVEPGFRVFPQSDKSLDVLGVLVSFAKNNGVQFKLDAEVSLIKKNENKIESVILKSGEEVKAKNFILATGGLSRPDTGSTGDGFKWLKKLGHNIVDPNPSLVPIKIKEEWISELAGITLENIGISVYQNNEKLISKKGRLLFTHEGISGPTVLNMSKDVGELLKNGPVKISLDFFSGSGLDVMNQRLLKAFENNQNKKIKNIILEDVPAKIFQKVLEDLEIDGDWYSNEITKEERYSIIEKMKKFEFEVDSLAGYDKAIVSSGGVDLDEVDFKTMSSKLYSNLFLIGDILNFDRNSGGYSLQLCWTTGYIAGKSAMININN